MSGPRRPYQLQSSLLRRHGAAIAQECFERAYATWPELEQRFGQRGRHHTAEDNFWHLDHLDTAVSAGAPEVFTEYTDWLVGLLLARGLGRHHIAGVYDFLAQSLDRIACPPRQESHRRELVHLLQQNRDRVLSGGPASGPAETEDASPNGLPAYLSYYKALRRLDRPAALAVAESYLAATGDVVGLYVDVFEAAQRYAGLEWAAGRLSVAHEHALSEVTRELVRRYGPSLWADPSADAPVALTACVPEERHSIGLMMLVDVLRGAGWVVYSLGEGLPASALCGLVAEFPADLLCLSCTNDPHLVGVPELIAQARRTRPGLRVVVGGPAIRGRDDVAHRLGADATAQDARAVRSRAADWKPTRGPDPSG